MWAGLFVTWVPASFARLATSAAMRKETVVTRPEYAVFLGLDVGKEEHHACALTVTGKPAKRSANVE